VIYGQVNAPRICTHAYQSLPDEKLKKRKQNILYCIKKLTICGQFFRDQKGVGMNFLH